MSTTPGRAREHMIKPLVSETVGEKGGQPSLEAQIAKVSGDIVTLRTLASTEEGGLKEAILAQIPVLEQQLQVLQLQAQEEAMRQAEVQAKLALEREQQLAVAAEQAKENQVAEQARSLAEKVDREKKEQEAMLVAVDYLPNPVLSELARYATEVMGGPNAVRDGFVDNYLASQPGVPTVVEQMIQVAAQKIKETRRNALEQIQDEQIRAGLLQAAEQEPIKPAILKKAIEVIYLNPRDTRAYETAVIKKAVTENLVSTEQAQLAVMIAQTKNGLNGEQISKIVDWLMKKQTRLQYLESQITEYFTNDEASQKGKLAKRSNLKPQEEEELMVLKNEKQEVERLNGYRSLVAGLPRMGQEFNKFMEFAPRFAKIEAKVRAEVKDWKGKVSSDFETLFAREYMHEEVKVGKLKDELKRKQDELRKINRQIDKLATEFVDEQKFEQLSLSHMQALIFELKQLKNTGAALNTDLESGVKILQKAFRYDGANMQKLQDVHLSVDLTTAIEQQVEKQAQQRLRDLGEELARLPNYSGDLFRYTDEVAQSLTEEVRLPRKVAENGGYDELKKHVLRIATNRDREKVQDAIKEADELVRQVRALMGVMIGGYGFQRPNPQNLAEEALRDLVYKIQNKRNLLARNQAEIDQKITTVGTKFQSLQRRQQDIQDSFFKFLNKGSIAKLGEQISTQAAAGIQLEIEKEANAVHMQKLEKLMTEIQENW